jgi:opacity protein-like surface antigen
MAQRLGFIIVGLMLVAPPVFAQKVEASFNVGYSASEGIDSDQRLILGQVYDKLAVDSGSSFNFTIGALIGPQFQVDFLWGRQNSRLQADGPSGILPFSELAVYSYMGNFVYNFGEHDARVRPYVSGGFGATQYKFDQLLVATPNAATAGQINSETKFASNWGGGVKLYFTPNVGAKVGLRWTPTYIKSDPAGVWCDPFYGCWQLVNNQYANQFETSAGITLRFD